MSQKDRFDRISTAAPVNKTAARVVGKGEHFTSTQPAVTAHWTAPPKNMSSQPGELTGIKFGRFTVLNQFGQNMRRARNSYWVVRCACGDYEARNTATILNPQSAEDRCQNCRRTAYLQKGGEAGARRERR